MTWDSAVFWAKTTPEGQPGISVRDHCINVGCVAEALIGAMPERLRGLLPAGAARLAALHDVGKVSPGFQQKCPAWMVENDFPPQPGETDHAKISQWFLQQLFSAEARKMKRWLMAVGAHHGQSKGPWIKDARGGGIALNGTTGERGWQQAREQLANDVAALFGVLSPADFFPGAESPDDAVLAVFAGLIAVADWIGSDEHFFSPAAAESPLPTDESRQLAAKAVAAIGLASAPRVRSVGFAELFRPLILPNQLQALAAEHCAQPGLWIIEAPMGCGKTEAALLAASKAIECSPPAWGWSAGRGQRIRCDGVLPTRVGMVRLAGCQSRRRTRAPHPRGDGPRTELVHSHGWRCSPPAWGWSDRQQPDPGARQVLPTRVGMVRGHARGGGFSWSAPHPRGDGPEDREGVGS
jgi:CRISPR-associated endonuclease Cas3-HD